MFLLESAVFALLGLELPALIGDLRNGESARPAQALAVAATPIAVRALWVFRSWHSADGSPAAAVRGGRRPWRRGPGHAAWSRSPPRCPIPLTTVSGAPVPGRDLMLVLAAAVILSLLARA